MSKKKNKGSKTKVKNPPTNTSTMLQTHVANASPKPVNPIYVQRRKKDLTRVSIDRDGKRALFSNDTGRIADNMHKNTPESTKSQKSSTAKTILKGWEMFDSHNKDEIT